MGQKNNSNQPWNTLRIDINNFLIVFLNSKIFNFILNFNVYIYIKYLKCNWDAIKKFFDD